jgi:alpha-tubulin suppressor-like RCC1 family protein
MKKRIFFTSLMSIAYIFFYLEPSPGSFAAANSEGFAIYLTKDDIPPSKMKILSYVNIAEYPIIGISDIISYNAITHDMQLADSAYERISKLAVPIQGKSFLICVNKAPIYGGAFWVEISSISFDDVVILKPFDMKGPKVISLKLGYPASSFYHGNDPRNNAIVMKSLEASGKLIDQPGKASAISTKTKLVAKAVTAGDSHTCALMTDGTIQCWGWNINGQLGDGSAKESNVPVKVVGISNAVNVVAGGNHTCAALGDGTVQCWGDSFGKFGRNPAPECAVSQILPCSVPPVSSPNTISGIANPTAIAAGVRHTCALPGDGTVQCWGHNQYGELGIGKTGEFYDLPVAVPGIAKAAMVGADNNTCVVLSSGALLCWGGNEYGELGNGKIGGHSNVPVTVSGIDNAVMVSIGGSHACALLRDGAVRCWGYNRWGELGDGTTTTEPQYGVPNPVKVLGIANAVTIAAGGPHSCAVLGNGTIQCWGYGIHGELGNGANSRSSGPVAVSGIMNATAVASGSSHNCALLGDGAVKCWGGNEHGQLGNGATAGSLVPVTVNGF